MDEIVPYLVGHTVEQVERELILQTLVYNCGNRTLSAGILGISIRSMRNKIHEYEKLGMSVPKPRTPMAQSRSELFSGPVFSLDEPDVIP